MLRATILRYRALLGALIRDRRRFRRALAGRGAAYLALCNRDELLEAAPNGIGYRCVWRWTSDLDAPKVLPALGLRLMKRALEDHPIRRAAAPAGVAPVPEVGFIIGHRGSDRLPHLLATLESIAGQRDVSIDCVVVEQDVQARTKAHLPGWVKHVHSPPPASGMPYCRSWAFNIGVKHSRADVLVLHDNDMLVSADYAVSILDEVRRGFEVVNLKRFIFYLTERHTAAVFRGDAGVADQAPLAIVQNLEAGGSIAITRAGYDRIGGMDESFIGWGGEDNEFWERAQTLRIWPYAHLPIVHFWHAAQPGKGRSSRQTARRYEDLSSMPADARISRLRMLQGGDMVGPRGA